MAQAHFGALLPGISTQAQAEMRSRTPRAGTSQPEVPSLPTPGTTQRPSPPQVLQLAGRILEGAGLCHGQAAQHFHVVQDSLALPIPLLDLVAEQGGKEAPWESSSYLGVDLPQQQQQQPSSSPGSWLMSLPLPASYFLSWYKLKLQAQDTDSPASVLTFLPFF